jgi:hypothetical protein
LAHVALLLAIVAFRGMSCGDGDDEYSDFGIEPWSTCWALIGYDLVIWIGQNCCDLVIWIGLNCYDLVIWIGQNCYDLVIWIGQNAPVSF